MSEDMPECKCTFTQKMVGDGCSICNPEHYIPLFKEEIEELTAQNKMLAEAVVALSNRNSGYEIIEHAPAIALAKEILEGGK